MKDITNRVSSLLLKEFKERPVDFKDGFTTALFFVDIAIKKEPAYNLHLKVDELSKSLEESQYRLKLVNEKLERYTGIEPERDLLLQQVLSLKANTKHEKMQQRRVVAKKILNIMEHTNGRTNKLKAIHNLVSEWDRIYTETETS